MSENYFEGWDDSNAIGQVTSNLSGLGWQAENQRKQQAFQGQQAQAQRAHEAQQAAASRNLQEQQLAVQARPEIAKEQRFGVVWPYLTNQLNSLSAGGGGGSPVGTQPTINTGGVYSPDQIQAQVNASRATTDQSTATNIKNQGQSLAGKGFGSNSPLMAALSGQAQAAGVASNASNETNLRTNAAQMNAKQQLAGQTEAENQYASRQQEDIERHRNYLSSYNSLIGALSGLI